MNTLTVKELKIGEGVPKIIVPIVDKTKEDIINKGKSFKEMKIDLVEWRADYFEDVLCIESVLDTLRCLKDTLNNIPIIFTFRTKNEVGKKDISLEFYTKLNAAVAKSGHVDIIDVEVFLGDEVVQENISNIHKAGIYVIGSSHDFLKTPHKDDLVSRMRWMQEMGADIPKVAVMPTSAEDVLTLLSASIEMYTKYANRPFITMSMGATGLISRLCGEVFGSSMTFGAVGQVSAPGQIPVEQLATILDILHHQK